MHQLLDYRRFYDLETYLLDTVGPQFRAQGTLEAADFYLTLIWKAERAKNRHRDRLRKQEKCDFSEAVRRLAAAIYAAPSPGERLRLLIMEWGFYTPTATALLTILYPEEFTVYDWRVAEQVKLSRDLANRNFSDAFWTEYLDFVERVRSAPPKELNLSLRDCDRYLTGKSCWEQVKIDCAS